MTDVLGYARTSPGTNEEGTSLPGQKQDIRDFCDERDWNLLYIFEDEDVSGRKTPPQEREGFSEMLGWLSERSNIDKIVVREKKRVARDTKVLMTLDMFWDTQVGREIDIYSVVQDGPIGVNEYGDSDDPMEKMMGELFQYMKNMMSELEAAMTAQNTRESLRRKKERGEPVGSIPWGLTTDKQKHGEDQATEYLPDDEDEDHFRTAIQIINDFEDRGKDPHEDSAAPVGRKYGMDHSNLTVGVRNIWDKRELYRQVAEDHRPDLTVL